MRARLMLALAPSLMLAGCSGHIPAIDAAACEAWQPVWISRKDMLTEGTAKQIAGNNASREAWCGRPSKPPKPNPVTS